MNRCWRVTSESLSEYVDRMLPDEKRAWLDEHLTHCVKCADGVRHLQSLKTELAALPAFKLSDDFDLNFKSALLEARREEKTAASNRVPQKVPARRVVVGLPRPVQAFAVALLSITAAIGIYSLLSPGPGVRLASATGTVEVRHSLQSAWIPVAVGTEIASGDELRTGKGAEAVFQAGRVYQAKLMEQSEWVPIDLAASRGHKGAYFVLKRGSLLVRTGPGFRGKSMRVEGPSGKAEVVGTAFMMKATPQGKTELSVIHGEVDMLGIRPGDAGKIKVGRLESVEVAQKGTPEMPRPMSPSTWKALAQFDPSANSTATAAQLLLAAERKARLSNPEIKKYQEMLLSEADKELASFGFYFLGNLQEEAMAPAEALKQYATVLTQFPEATESAWAAEFLRTKLDMVPSAADAMGEEVAVEKLEEPLKEIPTARGLTPEFLKGLEPQRRFVTMQMEVNETEEKWASVVDRAITLERDLGEKKYSVVGFLDQVRNRATGEVVLKVGKLFSRDEKGRVSEVNTAIFGPDGSLIYTIDRQIRYQGGIATGYLESYKNADAKVIAVLERKVDQRSRSGLILSYAETWKNGRGDLLLERKRSDIKYDPKGKVVNYQDELVDSERRAALERGVDRTPVEVGRERLLKVAETPVATMDEMLQKIREIRGSGASLKFDSSDSEDLERPTL